MGAQVTVRNDGPDAVEVRIGPSSRLLHAGQSICVATAAKRVEVTPLVPLTPAEMAMHMGSSPNRDTPCRYAED